MATSGVTIACTWGSANKKSNFKGCSTVKDDFIHAYILC